MANDINDPYLTKEQINRAQWLRARHGSGYVDKFGRIVAGGEVAPRDAFPAWLNLIARGYIAGNGDGRLVLTEKGQQLCIAQLGK